MQEFLSALKVGDRVITTGGIYGSITRTGEQSIQLQIANNVRIEVSRAAIVGYQGRRACRAVWHRSGHVVIMKNLQVETRHHCRRHSLGRVCLLPAVAEGESGARPQGRRAPGAACPYGRRASSRDPDDGGAPARHADARQHPVRTVLEATGPMGFKIEGLQDDAGFRQNAVDVETVFDRTSGAGAYTYAMKGANLANQLRGRGRDAGARDHRAPCERTRGVAEPIVARHSGREQILGQLPGVSEVQRAKEIIRSTSLLELRLVEQGPFPSREAALQAYNNVLPSDAEVMGEWGGDQCLRRHRKCSAE